MAAQDPIMPLRNIPWKNTAKDLAEIMRDPKQHFPTLPPIMVFAIKEEALTSEICWEMLLAACSAHCLHASIGPMLIRALGSTTPSPLMRMAMNGHYAQGRPQIEPSHWSFMPPALGRLSERDQALTHLRWARDGFLNQGWPAPEVLPRWAPLYPDQQDAPRLAAWRPW